jgi:hypothetical protein
MKRKDGKVRLIGGVVIAILVFLMSGYFFHTISQLTLVTLAISLIIGIGTGIFVFLDFSDYPESF